MKPQIFEVGGCIRDSLLGRDHQDKDFVMVADSFDQMKKYLLKNSKKIFLERPEFGHIRYLSLEGKPEDISLSAGTIVEDLYLRDFTMNAIARVENGEDLIDPLNGQEDIKNKIIRCCRTPEVIFKADPLRILRAVRFKIQLGFTFDEELSAYLAKEQAFSGLRTLERERVRQELERCFKLDAEETILEISKLAEHFRAVLFKHHQLKILVR